MSGRQGGEEAEAGTRNEQLISSGTCWEATDALRMSMRLPDLGIEEVGADDLPGLRRSECLREADSAEAHAGCGTEENRDGVEGSPMMWCRKCKRNIKYSRSQKQWYHETSMILDHEAEPDWPTVDAELAEHEGAR